jgi:beta-galactosidase
MSANRSVRPAGRPAASPVWGGGFLYGGDWNPEQWGPGMGYSDESVWREDIRLMQAASVNVACPGIFAWVSLQPAEDTYTFEWLDRVMDLLHEGGIGACLGTATAAQPAWLSKAYPDALPVDAWGHRRTHGTRMSYCPTSPDFRRLGQALVRKLAERYGDHPALRMWHISNEYGPTCICDRCAARFRGWLKARYGSLDGVNQAWVTAFWGHTYTHWEEIDPPSRLGEQSVQGLALDYHRFMSDMNLECFDGEAAILREATPELPAFTNFHGTHEMDYYDWARHQDVVGYDSYPTATDTPERTAFAFDVVRGLSGGRSWLLQEQTPSQTQWQAVNPLRRPGVVRLHSLQAVARGSDGAMFFQWRQSRGAQEMHHGAIVDHSGRQDTRTFREVAGLGAELARLGTEMLGSTIQARVALLYSWPVRWSLEFRPRLSEFLDYEDEVRRYHAALWRRNVAMDVVSPDAELSGYDLVIAPLIHLVSEPQADAIESYVRGGGSFLTTFFSGVVGEDGRAWLGGRPGPAALGRTLGIRVESADPFVQGQTNGLASSAVSAGDGGYRCDLWAEVVHLEGADAIATFTEDFVAGLPAVTEHRHGKGRAVYVATRPDRAFLDALVGRELHELGIAAPLAVPDGVELTQRRSASGSSYTFLLNHGDRSISVSLPAMHRELLSDRDVNRVELGAREVAILRGPT